jgi:ribosomal protein S18 acetylase RimI-like enzyme
MANSVERICLLALQHKQSTLKTIDSDAALLHEQTTTASEAATEFREAPPRCSPSSTPPCSARASWRSRTPQATNADADKARFRVTSFAATQQQLLQKTRDDTKAALDAHRALLAQHVDAALARCAPTTIAPSASAPSCAPRSATWSARCSPPATCAPTAPWRALGRNRQHGERRRRAQATMHESAVDGDAQRQAVPRRLCRAVERTAAQRVARSATTQHSSPTSAA